MSAITMPFIAIDTLQFSKRMQKAGLQKEVAEELAEAMKDAYLQSVEGIATKQDIKILEQKIDSLEHKITIRLFVMLTVAVGVIAWLDKIIS